MKLEILMTRFLFLSLVVLAALPVLANDSPITQGEWAVFLSRGLGLQESLPKGTGSDRFISILSRGGYQRIEGEDYREAGDALRKVDVSEPVVASQQQWVEAGEDSGVARYVFELPYRREATLRARGRGGPQFWSIDESGSIMITPGDELEWREVGQFNLEPGEHAVTVSISPGGVLDIFELVGPGGPPIEPLGGFRPSAPLTYGDKAVTIVRALNLENELPIDEGFYLIRESELYDQGIGEFQVREDLEPGRPSRGKWVRPVQPSRISFNFEVPRAGVYSISSRGFGRFEDEWLIDLGDEQAVTKPNQPQKFGWRPVATVYLAAGPHTLEVRLGGDNGFDVFKVIRHRAGAGDYLQLLSDLGMQEGSLPASPEADDREKRRYELFRAVEAEDFSEAEGKPAKATVEEYGEPSNRSWVNPGQEPARLRYRLNVSEEGTYAIYMRAFGFSPFTWVVDPTKEGYREKRDVFPLTADAFSWQEVVTLDLEAGEHIFEVTLPPDSGFDLFELRKQPWSSSDLEKLARESVDRPAAQRNVEELEKRIGEPEEEVGPERAGKPERPEEPEEPGEPEEPDYPILSPYVPSS